MAMGLTFHLQECKMSPITKFTTRTAISLPLIITLIFLTQDTVHSLRIARPHPVSPQIWLNEYMTVDAITGLRAESGFQSMVNFENEFFLKNGTDYIFQEGLRAAVFVCKAKYPIKWLVPDMTQVVDIVPHLISSYDVRPSEFNPDMDQPSNKFFRSFLALSSLSSAKFVSVTFSCQGIVGGSTEQNQAKSSLHIYVADARQVLEHQDETISITHDENSSLKSGFILPCRPSIPSTPITLEKEVDGEWTPILTESSPSLSFDPKIGFLLKRFFWGKKFLGLYRCTVNGSDVGRDEDAVVLLNVTSGPDAATTSLPKFESHLWTSKGASASVIEDENNMGEPKVKCCFGESSTSDVKGRADYDTCFDRFQCELVKTIIPIRLKKREEMPSLMYPSISKINSSTNCGTVPIYSNPALVMCKGENLDYAAELFMVFLPGVADLAKRKGRLLTILIEPAKADGVFLDQKILLAVAHRFRPGFVEVGHLKQKYPVFLDTISGRDFSQQYLLYFEDDDRVKTTEWLSEYTRNYYYEGEPLRIMCFGIMRFYSEGARLRINWKNGSRTVVKRDPNEGSRVLNLYGDAHFGKHHGGYGFISIFGNELNANLEMESVDCFMPIWDSHEWDKQTYNISTIPSNLPTFVGGEEEQIVHLYLNDTDKTISWALNEITPRAKIDLTKDEKKISGQMYNSSIVEKGNGSSIIVTIKFEVVTYETHGSYRCAAKNFKGEAFKAIKIIVVAAQSSIAIPTIICCVLVLSALALVSILIKYRARLHQMWRLKRSHFY